jgi:divalent metal cation (Fe/Co/Zn/Cd) transporter
MDQNEGGENLGTVLVARPADRRHPLGHGRASYLWAIVAACSTLVVGAGFSLTHRSTGPNG